MLFFVILAAANLTEEVPSDCHHLFAVTPTSIMSPSSFAVYILRMYLFLVFLSYYFVGIATTRFGMTRTAFRGLTRRQTAGSTTYDSTSGTGSVSASTYTSSYTGTYQSATTEPAATGEGSYVPPDLSSSSSAIAVLSSPPLADRQMQRTMSPVQMHPSNSHAMNPNPSPSSSSTSSASSSSFTSSSSPTSTASFDISLQQDLLSVGLNTDSNIQTAASIAVNTSMVDSIPNVFSDGDLISLQFVSTGKYLSRCPGCIAITPPNITQIVLDKIAKSPHDPKNNVIDVAAIFSSRMIYDTASIDALVPQTTEQWSVQFIPEVSVRGNRRIRLLSDTGKYLAMSAVSANSSVYNGGGNLVNVDVIAGQANTIWEVFVANNSQFALVADGTKNTLSLCRNCSINSTLADIAAVGESNPTSPMNLFQANVVQWMDPRLMPPRLSGSNVRAPFSNNDSIVMFTENGDAITRYPDRTAKTSFQSSVVQLPYMSSHAEVWTAAFVGDPRDGKVTFQAYDETYLQCVGGELDCMATADALDPTQSPTVWKLSANTTDGTWGLQLDGQSDNIFLGQCRNCPPSSFQLPGMFAIRGKNISTPFKLSFRVLKTEDVNNFQQSYVLDSNLQSKPATGVNTGSMMNATISDGLYILMNRKQERAVSSYTESTILSGQESIYIPHVSGPAFVNQPMHTDKGDRVSNTVLTQIKVNDRGHSNRPAVVNLMGYNGMIKNATYFPPRNCPFVVYPWSTTYAIFKKVGDVIAPMHSVWTLTTGNPTDWIMNVVANDANNHPTVTFQPKGWTGWYLKYVSSIEEFLMIFRVADRTDAWQASSPGYLVVAQTNSSDLLAQFQLFPVSLNVTESAVLRKKAIAMQEMMDNSFISARMQSNADVYTIQ